MFGNHNRAVGQLHEHVDNYFSAPEVWEEKNQGGGKGKRSGAPSWFCIVSLMWVATGESLGTLWDMSLSELACHKAVMDE